MYTQEQPMIACENLVKIYRIERREIVVLQGLDLEVWPGEIVAVAGASGSGKSTLLNVLGGLDTFDAGEARVGGKDLARMTASQRVIYRRDTVGYLWQQSGRNLLTHLTMRANVAAPMRLQGTFARKAQRRADELLDAVGLSGMRNKYVTQLSGGEQQRAALAVALANNPLLLLADEPTGELDSQTAQDIFDLLRLINREMGMTILLVTHDLTLATQAERMISIRDGRVSSESAIDESTLAMSAYRESVVIDRVGRLQLPYVAMERVAFRGRGDVHVSDDHVEIWPLSARSVADQRHGRGAKRGENDH